MNKKLISIVSGTFNEAENVVQLYERVLASIACYNGIYDFEFVLIDNASTDATVQIVKDIAARDPRVKLIVNNRNFGHIRSPYWGMLQATGDVIVFLASDLQDPPEVIPQFIAEWEKGWRVVMATKPVSQTNALTHAMRKTYYHLLDSISEVELIKHATGFGLYDRTVIEHVRKINDPYPYFRGLICDLGFPVKTIPFEQPRRERGISKNNFFTLFDIAMLGIVSHSLLPLRLASLVGLSVAGLSFLASVFYLVRKLLYWDSMTVGIAPLVIGMFFMFGLMFCFIGLLGEYIGSIHKQVKNRPIVVEKERVNFE